MFNFLKKIKPKPKPKPFPVREKTIAESDAIASPKQPITFQPIDVVAPSQSIPGKFDYHSATWKYLQNHLNDRLNSLRCKNDNAALSVERTQIIRGQLKEIKALLNHTNQLAGISVSPTKTSLGINPTDRGFTYE